MADQMKAQISPEELPLEEFIRLPATVAFNAWMTPAFRTYIADKPYIRLGTEFANNNAVLYTSERYMDGIFADQGYDFFSIFPQLYGLMGHEALESAHITWVHKQPYLDLKGSGVLLGFVDTGIDYTNPAFLYEDGSSKVQAIWDQTLEGTPPELIHFGAVYRQEQINEALRSSDPRSVVPHQDTQGHGTFLASVAGGRGEGAAAGAAPDSEIIAVKLRKASPYYIEKYLIPSEQDDVYESTDIMLGIKFIYEYAMALGRPVAICIGLGSNFGGHTGNSKLEYYLSYLASGRGIAICTACGNEGSARHHTQGLLLQDDDVQDVDIQVGANSGDLNVVITYPGIDTISVSIQSPTGERIGRVPFFNGTAYFKNLLFEKSRVSLFYYQDINRFAIVQVRNATPGIWRISLHGDVVISGQYNAYLPITGQVLPGIEFTAPYPDQTIVIPATGFGSICCTAYDPRDGSLYTNASWGPTAGSRLAPDLAAPGANVTGVYPTGEGIMSGTSVAASITAGACALLMQWGIVQENDISMNGYRLKTLLIRGSEGDENLTYPNNLWGYGKLDLEKTFQMMRED